MILVFGGTTEGRRAVKALEAAGRPYFYSTKTGEQEVAMVHGIRTDGAMNADEMGDFCRRNDIRLIVDAAHPFASRLHRTIADVASSIGLPVVRFERIYPPRDPDITWIEDYRDIPVEELLRQPHPTLLATTGVQSIVRLRWLEERGIRVMYRILNRESSLHIARQAIPDGLRVVDGDALDFPLPATEEYLWVSRNYTPPLQGGSGDGSAESTFLLLKESGLSGGFLEKVTTARSCGMHIIALKRPPMPWASSTGASEPHRESIIPPHGGKEGGLSVDGEYGLRRMVERILQDFFPLHSGLTTGTCATAAAIAATLRLLTGERPEEVPVRLPNGETISVPVQYGDDDAYVVKDAGNDPDVTHGIEVRAAPLSSPHEGGKAPCASALPLRLDLPGIEVYAGEGIGRFTLPGLDFPPGEPAINRVPREMIQENLTRILQDYYNTSVPDNRALEGASITLSVPNGEAIARRTFNPRLGIEGGISIIGVSGIVMPYSEEAFIDSIRRCMEVARASGSPRIVIGSGMKSEQQLRRIYPDLPSQAFVEYGNYIGETLKMAHELHASAVTLGIMIGKAVKLAQGHLDTHSRRVTMDRNFVAQLLREADCPPEAIGRIEGITVARELWDILSPKDADRFFEVIVRHCYEHCKPLLPKGELTILLLRNE